MRRQLFISHTWKLDQEDRDTHARARELKKALERFGWTVWFDETDMKGNIEASIADGIQEADAVIMLLTRQYARKVNHAARGISSNDNCLKEFNYSFFMNKLIIPVVFEPGMLCSESWSPGIVPMRLSMELYVDGSGNDFDKTARDIQRSLCMFGRRPISAPYDLNCRATRCSARNKLLQFSIPHSKGPRVCIMSWAACGRCTSRTSNRRQFTPRVISTCIKI